MSKTSKQRRTGGSTARDMFTVGDRFRMPADAPFAAGSVVEVIGVTDPRPAADSPYGDVKVVYRDRVDLTVPAHYLSALVGDPLPAESSDQ